MVSGNGSIIGVVANTTGQVTAEVGNTINNVAISAGELSTGVVSDVSTGTGNVGQVADNIIGTTGNIIENVADNVGSTVTDGVGVDVAVDIVSGVKDVFEKIYNETVNIIEDVVDCVIPDIFNGFENLLGTVGNVFQAIGNTENGIVGKLVEIGGSSLKVPFKIFGDFARLLNTIIGSLGNLSAELVKSFTAAIQSIGDIGKGVASKLDTFFQKSIGLFIDFLVKPALSEANNAYTNVAAALTKAIAAANVIIEDLVSNFDDKIKETVALATNKVTDLAAELTNKLNESVASASIIADCDTKLKISLVEFAAKSLPNIALCIVPSVTFNVTDFANKAIETVGGTLEQSKTIVTSLQKCIDPVLANLKDSAAKDTARFCLLSVSVNMDLIVCFIYFFLLSDYK